MFPYKFSEGWDKFLHPLLNTESYSILCQKLAEEYNHYEVYPKREDVFRAFQFFALKDLKVVIIGQDPYHQPHQATGLSFSIPRTLTKVPPSLKNIYKELNTDLNIPIVQHGDLTNWAKQGVLLLNSTLTVRSTIANSHKNIGWQGFTDHIIEKISTEQKDIVFLLWGNYAKTKAKLIDSDKHCILNTAHPSPLARGAFFGSKHFSKTNQYLESVDKTPIDWSLE